jgi:hypothetical protein
MAGSFAIRQSKTIHRAVPDCPDLQAGKTQRASFEQSAGLL